MFDGDLVLVIDNKLYSTGVHRDAIPVIDVDDKITVQDEEDNSENRAKIVLRTMKNMIGEFSNYSSAYHNKKAHDKEQRKKYDKYIDIIAVATGKSIDYAKTGVLYNIPRHIAKYGRPLPYFMKYRGPYYANQTLSKSMSNMNRLCYAIEHWDRKNKWARADGSFDYKLMIDDNIPVEDDVISKLDILFKQYLAEMKEVYSFQAKCRNYPKYSDKLSNVVTKEEALVHEVNWTYYFDKYKKLANDICDDQKKLANAAVILCYERYPKKDKKFIWVIAEDGILQNIKQVKHKLPKRVFEKTNDEYLGKYYIWLDYDGDDEKE